MIERFIPTCKETGKIGPPEDQINEIIKPSIEKRKELQTEASSIRFSDKLIGNYPKFPEIQIQEIFSKVIDLMNKSSTTSVMNYMKNILGTPFIQVEDIHRFFIFNNFVLNLKNNTLEEIKTKSIRRTPSGNNYILIDSEYSSGGATLGGGSDGGLPIVVINSSSDFRKAHGELQNSMPSIFPLFSSFIPSDRHFQSEVMSIARIANEEAHVDFSNRYNYNTNTKNTRLCMLIDGHIPTMRDANEFLSDVESFKRAGPGFLVQSITYGSSGYILQSKIFKKIMMSFGISPTGEYYDEIHKVLEKGNTAEEIVGRFLEWEAPIREALKPFEI